MTVSRKTPIRLCGRSCSMRRDPVPRARPGVSSRMGTCPGLQMCPCEGAEVTTAAQVQDTRLLAQRQRVGGELRLRLPAEGGLSWCRLRHCNGLQTFVKMTYQEMTATTIGINYCNNNWQTGY